MFVTVWKKEKESNERTITRFTKKVQASRKLVKLKKAKFHQKDATRRQERAAAIAREAYRKKRERYKFYG